MGQPPLLSVLLSSLQRRWPVGAVTLASTLGAALLYLLLVPPRYTSSVRLMVDERNTSISALGQALSELSSNTPIGVNPLATQSELITSQEVLGEALETVSFAQDGAGRTLPTLNALKQDIEVKILPATNILEITYDHTDAAFTVQLLEALAQSVVKENTASIRLEASSVRYFLETKIPQQEVRLAQAEELERQFREENGIVSIETQTQSLLDALGNLQNEELSLRVELQDVREKQRLLTGVTGADSLDQAYITLQMGQSATLQDLDQRLNALEADIAEARSRLGDQHPDLLALYDQRTELQGRYTDNLDQLGGAPAGVAMAQSGVGQELLNQYILGQIQQAALVERLGVVQREKDRFSRVVLELPQKQQALAALVRRRTEAESTLQLLQDKLEEARIAEAQLVSNIRTLGAPVMPQEPSSPNPKVTLVLGMVVGLLLAGGAIAALEILDDTLHSADSIAALLDLPVLGDLPPLPPPVLSARRLRDFLDDDALVEPYRRLLNNLGQYCRQSRLDGARTGHAVVFSSVQAGDGKSATAIYLAVVAALLSRQALILDADLRQPSPTHFFGAAEEAGFADVIDQAVPAAAVVQPTGLESLFLLPCGQAKDRPATIVESPAVAELLESLRDRYDWTFIDTPILATSVDAVALRQAAEGLVLVVRPGHTRRRDLVQAAAEVRRSGATILGVVLNQTALQEELFLDFLQQTPNLATGFTLRPLGQAGQLRSLR